MLPVKFQPVTVSITDLREAATREKPLISQQFRSDGDGQLLEEIWAKTMEEVRSGSPAGRPVQFV